MPTRNQRLRSSRVQRLVEVIQLCNGVPLDQKHIQWRMKGNLNVIYLFVRILVKRGLLEQDRSKMYRARVYRATEEGKRIAKLYGEVEEALRE